MNVERALQDFVNDPSPRAIALRGKWGTGKTYFWKKRVAPSLGVTNDGYSYVSLFGIDSLSALKAATAVTTTPLPGPIKEPTDTRPIGLRELWQGLGTAIRFIAREGGPLDTPYVSAPAAAMWLALRQMKARVVCFDDLERRGDGLGLRDFLGFVTYLVEERECRVVVIVNDETLSNDADWIEQREKVFQWDVRLEPTPDEAMIIGLSSLEGSPHRDDIASVLRVFGVTNIRLIARCADHARKCLEAIADEKLHPSTVRSIVRSSAIYAYSTQGRGSGAPPMDFLRRRGTIDREHKEEPHQAALQSSWEAELNELGYYFKDETDAVLAQFAERGYLDSVALREAAHKYNLATVKHEAKQRFYDSWQVFHSAVGGAKQDVIDAFRETWPAASPYENAGNLESLAHLLRELGEPGIATEFIQEWCRQRTGIGSTDLSDREVHIFRQITDAELLAAIATARENQATNPSLSAAFAELRAGGFSDTALDIIGSSTPEAVAEFWRENDSRATIDTARNIINYASSVPRHSSAKNNLLSAAALMANDSELAAIRIKAWFNVAPEKVARRGESKAE